LEIVEASGDASGMRSSRLDVLSQDLAHADALPVEVLSQSFEIFLTAATWGAHQENSPGLVHLDFLEQELEGVLGSLNDQLLEVILEHLVDLMLVQVLLNRLHVVELLHLIHLMLSQIFAKL